MNETAIKAALREIPLGGLRVFQSIGSTNDEAKAWAAAGAPDLSLIVADEQTAGRGRGERRWYTPAGTALALSLIMRPRPGALIGTGRHAGLGALAISDACSSLGLAPAIKWPNDVLLSGKKVAGVLAETEWNGDVLGATILGIGVNVLEGSVPANGAAAYPATSISGELGRPVERVEVLTAIVVSLIRWREGLAGADFIGAWERQLAFRDQQVLLTRDGQPTLSGKLLGLESDGSLRLEVDQMVMVVQAGETHLRPTDDRIA